MIIFKNCTVILNALYLVLAEFKNSHNLAHNYQMTHVYSLMVLKE